MVFRFVLSAFVATLVVWAPARSTAATHEALTCSRGDVLDAVNAASDGDTVLIPPEKCTWKENVKVSKRITIKGAGASKTVITAGTDVNIFTISQAARITGIGFFFDGKKKEADVRTYGRGFRIDHCNFTHSIGGYGITPSGSFPNCAAGLIDNNVFVDARIYVSCGNKISSQQEAMAAPMELGTDNAVYIEDNAFTRTATGNLIDSNRGGKWVARYNTGEDAEFMAHGRNKDAINRGTRSWEIYNNLFHATGKVGGIVPVFLRSGEGMIFNNTVTGKWTWTDGMLMSSDRSLSSYGAPCDGTHAMDGNIEGQNGWPCRDQVGTGKDEKLSKSSGEWPNIVVHWEKQTTSPVYLWGNDSKGFAHSGSKKHIKENRDFFDSFPNDAQTSPMAPFDGSVSGTSPGVGYGTFSNRPKTCTKGVAYWATDRGGNWDQSNNAQNDGCLYKCSSANNWTLFYTPYTYPHPKRGGAIAGSDGGATGEPDGGPEMGPDSSTAAADSAGEYQDRPSADAGIDGASPEAVDSSHPNSSVGGVVKGGTGCSLAPAGSHALWLLVILGLVRRSRWTF